MLHLTLPAGLSAVRSVRESSCLLRFVPLLWITTSQPSADVLQCYAVHALCMYNTCTHKGALILACTSHEHKNTCSCCNNQPRRGPRSFFWISAHLSCWRSCPLLCSSPEKGAVKGSHHCTRAVMVKMQWQKSTVQRLRGVLDKKSRFWVSNNHPPYRLEKSTGDSERFVVCYFLEDSSYTVVSFDSKQLDSNGDPEPQHRWKASKCPEKVLKPKCYSIIHFYCVLPIRMFSMNAHSFS